jgi:Cft2 family RNA processing exonuclease
MFFNAIMFHADSLDKVLSSGGSVLLPVDTAGRVLELLLILDKVKSLILSQDSVFLLSQ